MSRDSQPVEMVHLALTDTDVDVLWACVRFAADTISNHTNHDPAEIEIMQDLAQFLQRAE
tara:strand:+ start:311 stop:490 length:180 start_codon:yes stop_codon:yes gene_type:complete